MGEPRGDPTHEIAFPSRDDPISAATAFPARDDPVAARVASSPTSPGGVPLCAVKAASENDENGPASGKEKAESG